MATVMVPTMRSRTNPNPKGSATAHVTMAAANPFERETLSIREANQPVIYGMMPGLGKGDDKGLVSTSGDTAPASAPAEKDDAPSWWSGYGQNLLEQVTGSILVPRLQQEVLRSEGSNQLTSPSNAPLPIVNPNQYAPPAAPQSNMTMPLVIGGLGLLVVGGIFLMGRGKGRAPARRSRGRRR